MAGDGFAAFAADGSVVSVEEAGYAKIAFSFAAACALFCLNLNFEMQALAIKPWSAQSGHFFYNRASCQTAGIHSFSFLFTEDYRRPFRLVALLLLFARSFRSGIFLIHS